MSALEEITSGDDAAAIAENPFKFLDYYDEDDASVFAGRSEEIMRILADFTRSRTFTLYGRTGLGKTSLLRAGLFPRLRDLGYLPIYIRLLDHPVQDVLNAVRRTLSDANVTKADLPSRLAGVSELAAADDIEDAARPIVLVFDQFEELFIRFERRPDERKALRVLLRQIASFPNSSVSILFSLREDFVAQMEDLRNDLPDVMTQSYRLLPLTAYGAREAIVLSLKRTSIEADAQVLNALITKLEARGFSPLDLQIYCTELYRAARRRNPAKIRFTEADMAAVGDIQAIHEQSLAELVKRLSADQALLLCCVLDVLKSADRTKLALRIADVVHPELAGPALSATVYFTATEDDATWALLYLVSRRVVRKVPGDEGWFELLHDGMVPAIESWLPKNAQFVKFQQARISVETLSMFSAHLRQDYLIEGVQPWKHLLRLSANATAYVFRSVVLEHIDDVTYWADRYDSAAGAGAACRALAKWLDAEEPNQRAAAATAVARLGAQELSKKLLSLALDDKSSEVRMHAAEAIALLGDFDVVRLRRACWNQRSRALDVLAAIDLHSPGKMDHFSRFARLSARDRGVRKQVRFDSATSQRRLAYSAGIGAGAGVLWAIVVLPLLLAFFDDLMPPIQGLSGSKIFIVLAPGIAACVGALLAWRTCLRVDRFAILNNTQSNIALTRVGGGWTQMIVVTILAVVTVMCFDPDLDRLYPRQIVRYLLMALPLALLLGRAIHLLLQKEDRRPYPAVVDALAVLGLGTSLLGMLRPFHLETFFAIVTSIVTIVGLLTPGAVSIIRSASRDFATVRSVALWSLLAAAPPVALLLLVAGILVLLRGSIPLSFLTHFGLMLFAAAILMSLTTPVIALSLAIWRARSRDTAERTSQSPLRARLFLVGSAVAIVPLVLWVFGLHSVALVPQAVDHTETINITTRPWPTAHHLVHRPPAGARAVDVVLAADCEDCNIAPLARKTIEFLSVADQASKFSVTSQGVASDARLRVVTSQLVGGGLNVATPADWKLISLPLRCMAGGVWVGEWNGNVPSYPPTERVVVQPVAIVSDGKTRAVRLFGAYPGGGGISLIERSRFSETGGLNWILPPGEAINTRILPDHNTYLLISLKTDDIPCNINLRKKPIEAMMRISRAHGSNFSYRNPTSNASHEDYREVREENLYKLAIASHDARYGNEAAIQAFFWRRDGAQYTQLAEAATVSEPLNAEYLDTLSHLLLRAAGTTTTLRARIMALQNSLAEARIADDVMASRRLSDELVFREGQLGEELRYEPEVARAALDKAKMAHLRSVRLGGTPDPICRYDKELFAEQSARQVALPSTTRR